jgi:UDP-4-amino-4-deoxy-L-arabinose formyltransferase/UDP-glucuronic acid dehydrogenase (UDP-4-keto-hexauronic acid decarboxylating)
MKVAIIGRTETLLQTIDLLVNSGHEISCIITSKEAPEYIKKSSDFEQIASELDVPYSCTSKISNCESLIRQSSPDIAVSYNYTGIIPSSIIKLFPLGVLNAHGGDLPRYRGNACQAWAIINGETKIGLCIHKMIGGELDSGDIVLRKYLEININTKVTEIWNWMDSNIPHMFLESINKLVIDNNYYLEKQSNNLALRCYPRMPEDGEIHWGTPAIDILRLINASNKPYQGAFCYFNGKKMIIWDAELHEHENYLAIPGQVSDIGKGYIVVATGSGKLRINKVEIGGDVLDPSSFIKSIRTRLH